MVDKMLIVEVLEGNMLVHSIYDNLSAARIAFDENFMGDCNEINEKMSVVKNELLSELTQMEEAQSQYDLIVSERGYCTLPPHYYGNEVTVKEFLE